MPEDTIFMGPLREFLSEVDSLLSCLVHRHGAFMESINEKEEAKRLYFMARDFHAACDFASLDFDKRKQVLDFIEFLKGAHHEPIEAIHR